MVRDDVNDVGTELVAAPAPEQVEQAVVLARDQDRHPLLLSAGEARVHVEAPPDVVVERHFEVVLRIEAIEAGTPSA